MSEEKLILDNVNLIYHVLQKLKLYHLKDDYYDVGIIGLIKGVKSFNPELNCKLSTYLYKCIENEIIKEIRMENSEKRKSNKNIISLETPLDDNFTLSDTIPSEFDVEESLLEKELMKWVYNQLSNLKEQEEIILNYYFGLNGFEHLTECEIAKKLNFSQTYINRIKNKALNKIRNKIFSEESEVE